MLLNTLQDIKSELIKDNITSEEKIEKFIDLFKIYDIGQYVYPDYFINSSNLKEQECYKIMSALVYLGILKQVYKILCPLCQHVSNNVLESFNEVEEYIFCEECCEQVFDHDNPLKYVVLFYKVIGWNNND